MMKKKCRILLMVLVLCYGVMCAYLYLFQRDILYHPADEYAPPSVESLPDMAEVTVTTDDDVALASWYQEAPKNGKTILFLHGNTGGLTERTDSYRQIIDAGYGLLALDYRGFSRNAGVPSEEGLYRDGRAGMEYLRQQGVTPYDVIVMGHSLGTGIAVQMATEYPTFAVALIAPFTSMVDIGSDRYWFAPVGLLLKDRYDSLSKLKNVDEPVLIFHGEKDNIVPVSHAHQLYAALRGQKKLYTYKGVGHNDVDMQKVIKALKQMKHETKYSPQK